MSQHFGEVSPELNDLREEIAEDGKGALDTLEGMLTGQIYDEYDLKLRIEVLRIIVRLGMRWPELLPTLDMLMADADGWLSRNTDYAAALQTAYALVSGM